jgi:hypothetical protein
VQREKERGSKRRREEECTAKCKEIKGRSVKGNRKRKRGEGRKS